jgi:hypothetical protein
MAGLIAEGKEAIEADGDDDVKDAWLIAGGAARRDTTRIAAYVNGSSSMRRCSMKKRRRDCWRRPQRGEGTDQASHRISKRSMRRPAASARAGTRKMKPMRSLFVGNEPFAVDVATVREGFVEA